MTGPWHQLEPDALNGSADSDDQRVQLSIAISLKRIADAVCAASTDGVPAPLHNGVLQMAWEAGQAFGRGQGAA